MSSYESPEVRAAAARMKGPAQVTRALSTDIVRPVRIFHDDFSVQVDALADALENAEEITICGIAGPALIMALSKFAVRAAADRSSLPWRRLHYITPEPSIALAARGELGLGPVVRTWQSALEAVRNCLRQDLRLDQPIGPGVADQVELSVTPMMYLESIIRIIAGGRSEVWAAIGPHLSPAIVDSSEERADAAYLILHSADPLYGHLNTLVEKFVASARPYPLRQVTCSRIDTAGLNRITSFDLSAASDLTDEFPVDGLRPFGIENPVPKAGLPVAAVAVRAATARGPVIVLRQRDRGLESDAFGKLSLITGRIYEEDLASSLGVSPFFDKDEDAALEEMWRAADMEGPLCVSLNAFVRAAQREVYACFGLDVAPARFKLRGFQALDHDSGDQNLFAVFDLVLDPRQELTTALTSPAGRFEAVRQAALYTEPNVSRLNHLLDQRRDWLLDRVLSQPVIRRGH